MVNKNLIKYSIILTVVLIIISIYYLYINFYGSNDVYPEQHTLLYRKEKLKEEECQPDSVDIESVALDSMSDTETETAENNTESDNFVPQYYEKTQKHTNLKAIGCFD